MLQAVFSVWYELSRVDRSKNNNREGVLFFLQSEAEEIVKGRSITTEMFYCKSVAKILTELARSLMKCGPLIVH